MKKSSSILLVIVVIVLALIGHDLFTILRHKKSFSKNFLLPFGLGIYYSDVDPHGEWYTEKVGGAKFLSFKALNDGFGIDSNSGYYELWKIPQSDIHSFTALNSTIAKDNNYVYFWHNKMANVDPVSFITLKEFFMKDTSGVYYLTFKDPLSPTEYIFKKIEGADPSSFEELPNGYGKDNKTVFLYTGSVRTLPGARPASFQQLSYGYSKDNHAVYFEDKLVEGADAPSFYILDKDQDGYYYGQDKNGKYLFGTLVK